MATMTGRLVEIRRPVEGTSKAGKKWSKIPFFVQWGNSENGKTHFDAIKSEHKQLIEDATVGSIVTIGYTVFSREHNGSLYHSVVLNTVDFDKQQSMDMPAQVGEPIKANVGFDDSDDDLPF